ncbi:serine hydrolase [Phenylobacterium sp.]|uniref:serine hydrolase domain-containing protein n=1 Tax=Phenylobacterium sp. TaxID=1871053 RepID=UPI0025D51AFC|nr:serine hydrolase domain-containing protein [Phenylobacterium sp.]MBX3482172.1 beta-lactamase family protein [Phenylobacterium sp.]
MLRQIVRSVLVALAIAVPARAAPDADGLARVYVEAINSADPAAVERFQAQMTPEFAASVPLPVLIDYFADQRRISGGGVDLVGARVRPGAAPTLEVALRNRVYGGVQGATLPLVGDKAPRFSNLDLVPAPAWVPASGPPLSQGQFAARVAELADRGCAAGVFSGAVLLAAGDKVLATHACGEASRRYRVANTPDTRFNLGSMDKMFTAVAAAQLIETGKLDPAATIDRYLDAGWIDPAVARRVTVWQLMTHTSGLEPDFLTAMKDKARTGFRELADYKPLTRLAHTTFEPGTKYEYSNTGVLILGAVVASASGEDYFAYVRDHVFRPAGMTASGAFAADDPEPGLAVGYYRAQGSAYGWRENTLDFPLRGSPAGGGYATVGDLHRFLRAVQTGRLVSPASRAKLWTRAAGGDYGAGFETVDGAVGRTVGHSGFYKGISTKARIYLDRGYIAVVLSNIDRGAVPLLDAIEGEMLRAPKAD